MREIKEEGWLTVEVRFLGRPIFSGFSMVHTVMLSLHSKNLIFTVYLEVIRIWRIDVTKTTKQTNKQKLLYKPNTNLFIHNDN